MMATQPVQLLVDTCVWLDIAGDHRNRHLVHTIEQLFSSELKLIVPRIVIDEFARNKERLIRENAQSLASALRRTRELEQRFGTRRRREGVLNELGELERRLVNFGDEVADLVTRVDKLLKDSVVFDIDDAIKLRAADRAIEKRAPFHRSRNGMADALLMETYADKARNGKDGEYFAFVTHNVKDFSAVDGDNRKPHPDFAAYFSAETSHYFTSLVDAMKHFFGQDVDDLTRESQLFEAPPRSLKEIQEAEEEITLKRWYDHHQMRAQNIKAGRTILVEKAGLNKPLKAGQFGTIQKDIWKGAMKAAREVERRYGKKNLGPYTDFEWGMLAGKHSAIRWVLGEEWDMLDT
jgi:rRNA-processing protein FCF1